MYYTYIIRCKDNSLYTGITKDVERRWQEHLERGEKCAKYTKTHPAEKLEAVWQTESRVLASKLEYHIKALEKAEKEELIKSQKLSLFLNDRLECDNYKIMNISALIQ